MKNPLFSYRAVGLAMILGSLMAAPAQAATSSIDTSACSNPLLSQPFLASGDSNWYTLMPGESSDNFAGDGWQLSGGAKIVATKLADGTTGSVLDLPSGSKAVSPIICVTSSYPTARTMVRNVKGSEGVFFYVEYEGTKTWGHPKNTGQIHGNGNEFTLVTPVNLQPENTSGWQPMRITLVPGGKHSDFEVYDLYLDPRFSG